MAYTTYQQVQSGSTASQSRVGTVQGQQAGIVLDAITQDDITEEVSVKKIYSVSIDTNKMTTGVVSRQLTIKAEIGANFNIIVLQDDSIKFYNFITNSFQDGHVPACNFRLTMSSLVYRTNIVFPDTGGSYTIKVISEKNTVTSKGSVFSRNIEKESSNATLTFQPSTVNTTKYASFTAKTQSELANANVLIPFSFTLTTLETDAGSFGFKFLNFNEEILFPGNTKTEVKLSDLLFFQTTKTITTNPAGSGVASTIVTPSDTTDLTPGMEIFYHKTTTAPSSTTTIISVDGAGEIKVDNAVAFEEGQTMTIRAYGSKTIFNAIGIIAENATTTIASFTEIVKKVRTDGSGASDNKVITLDNTKGIAGGSTVTFAGLEVNADGALVDEVTPDASGGDGDGSILAEAAPQNLSAGTVLTFSGSVESLTITGTLSIESFPNVNREINIDLDKLLTPGAAS